MDRRGEELFFIRMMGLGDPSGETPEDREPLFDYITPLEIEMKICTQWLHCTHGEFLELPIEERSKLLLYEEKERRREDHINKLRKSTRDKELAKQKQDKTRRGV